MDEMTAVQCPFCPEERRPVNHIAEHLESIALFVLPLDVEEDATDEDISSDEMSHQIAGKGASWRTEDSKGFMGSFAPDSLHQEEKTMPSSSKIVSQFTGKFTFLSLVNLDRVFLFVYHASIGYL
jgi:hypothetical protein